MMTSNDYLEAVHDRASFLEFVRALMRDREEEVRKEKLSPSSPYGPGAGGWENASIEGFLESAVGWAEDVTAHEDERRPWFSETPSWPAFARFLYMGKIYE
jgi:hypothetical protein